MRRPILLVAGAVITALIATSVVGSLHNKKSDQRSGANTPAPQGQVASATCPEDRYTVLEKTTPTGSYVEGGITVTNGDPKKALVEFIDQRAAGYPSWIAMAVKTLVDPSTDVKQKQKDFVTQCGDKKYLSLEGQKALETLSAVAKGAEVSTLTTAECTWTSGLITADGSVIGAKGADDGKEAIHIASANNRVGEMTLACANWHTVEGALPKGDLPRVPESPATPPVTPTPPNHGGDVKVASPWNGEATHSVDNGRMGHQAQPAAKTPQVVANGSGAQAPLPAASAGGVAHGTTGGANYGGASQPRPSNAPTATPAGEVKPPAGMEGM